MVNNELIIEERNTDLEIQGFYLYIDEDNFITGYSSSRVPNAPFIPAEKLPNQDIETNLLLYRYENGELIFDDSKINQMIEDREQVEEDERLAEIEKERTVDELKNQIQDLQLTLEQKDIDIFNTQIALADVYELLMGGF